MSHRSFHLSILLLPLKGLEFVRKWETIRPLVRWHIIFEQHSSVQCIIMVWWEVSTKRHSFYRAHYSHSKGTSLLHDVAFGNHYLNLLLNTSEMPTFALNGRIHAIQLKLNDRVEQVITCSTRSANLSTDEPERNVIIRRLSSPHFARTKEKYL